MGLPFHPLWLILILAIVRIIFGPGKLPELGGAVGRAMRDFQHSMSGARGEEPAQPEPETALAKAETSPTTTDKK